MSIRWDNAHKMLIRIWWPSSKHSIKLEASSWSLIWCRNHSLVIDQTFVHLAIDHRARRNLHDGFTDKERAPETACHLSEWQQPLGSVWFTILLGVLQLRWVECRPQMRGCKPGQFQVQMKKTHGCFPSNGEAGGSSLQAGLLPPLALIYSNMNGATLGLVITWVYNSFTEQLALHLEQLGCNN